ncbi:MAG TPA: cytochrome c [Candidatus Polarisedimenticolaceae bacterium]|nr:cytochrome c [Candidatus Polarisedimenticolaceae bacterium]
MKRIACSIMILAVAALVAAPVLAQEDGAALYKSKCAMCHGADGVAKKMAEPSRNLNDPKFQAEATKESIAKVVGEGKGKMKPVKLSPEQIEAVAAHVKTLK